MGKDMEELLRDLRELVEVATLGGVVGQDENNVQTIGNGKEMLRFGEPAYRLKESLAQGLWHYRKAICDQLSLNIVTDQLAVLVRQIKQNALAPNVTTLTSFFNELETQYPVEPWKVYEPLYGTNPLQGDPLTLGPFTVYQWDSHVDLLRNLHAGQFAAYPDADAWWETLWRGISETHRTFVSAHVQARDQVRAVELGKERFRQFTNTVRFMIGHYNGLLDVGTMDYRHSEFRSTVTLSPTRSAEAGHVHGALVGVDLEDPLFTDKSRGYDVIWDLWSHTNPTDLHRRILSAVEWGGKAARDADPSKAFVQCVFGLEALFTWQEKGVLVSPSVASQIAEGAAFVLGKDLASRRDIARYVGDMYRKRSGIAHGGFTAITLEDVIATLQLLRNVVSALLTYSELSELKRVEELKDWLMQQRFS